MSCNHLADCQRCENIVEQLEAKNAKLREALSELVRDIESWETAVRAVISADPNHGMDLTKAKTALEDS